MTLAELAAALKNGDLRLDDISAWVDGNELYVVRKSDGEHLFDDDVGPEEVAMLLGIEDVNTV